MLKVHTSDGRTHPVDLFDEEQAREMIARLSREDFQATVNGVSLVERHPCRGACRNCGAPGPKSDIGVQYSVTRPEGHRRVSFAVEPVHPSGKIKGAERVIMFADDVRLVLTAHHSQPAARVSLAHVGSRKFNPNRR